MALMKFCDKCKTKYPYGEECPNNCKAKAKKEADSYYNVHQRVHNSFYDSKEWRRARAGAMNRYNSLCLWSYVKHKKITQATLVHHIIEVRESKKHSLDINNLIPMSDEAHREVHKLYRTVRKREIQEDLRKIKNIWDCGGEGYQ